MHERVSIPSSCLSNAWLLPLMRRTPDLQLYERFIMETAQCKSGLPAITLDVAEKIWARHSSSQSPTHPLSVSNSIRTGTEHRVLQQTGNILSAYTKPLLWNLSGVGGPEIQKGRKKIDLLVIFERSVFFRGFFFGLIK